MKHTAPTVTVPTGIVGPFELQVPADTNATPLRVSAVPNVPSLAGATLITGLLSAQEVSDIQRQLSDVTWVPTPINGVAREYVPGEPVLSGRASAYSPAFAKLLFSRLSTVTQALSTTMNDQTPCDHDGDHWEPCGINPLMRFIRYEQGGALIPHYDGPYDSGTERSMITAVIYLGTSGEGGSTRFIREKRTGKAVSEFQDCTEPAGAEDVLSAVQAPAGSALLFWHRTLHDSEPLRNTLERAEKTIIRTDVMFRRLP